MAIVINPDGTVSTIETTQYVTLVLSRDIFEAFYNNDLWQSRST